MSQRSAYTSEYIYSWSDYEVLRKKAEEEGNEKYLNFAPPAKWSNGSQEFEMPIIQGKIGADGPGFEYEVLAAFLRGVKTEYPVSFVIIPEGHDDPDDAMCRVMKLTKTPDGEVHLFAADQFYWIY